MSEFGAKIRSLRKAAGLEQVEVARRLGVSSSHLYALEYGRTTATMSMLRALSVAIPMAREQRSDLTAAWASETSRYRVEIADPVRHHAVAHLIVGVEALTDADVADLVELVDRRAA